MQLSSTNEALVTAVRRTCEETRKGVHWPPAIVVILPTETGHILRVASFPGLQQKQEVFAPHGELDSVLDELQLKIPEPTLAFEFKSNVSDDDPRECSWGEYLSPATEVEEHLQVVGPKVHFVRLITD